MKVRQVSALLAVLVIGLLAGSLVSGMFPATSRPAVSVLASRPAPHSYAIMSVDRCAVPISTAEPGGPTAAFPDVEKLVAANARVGMVFGARRELGIEVIGAHVECARMIEANLNSFRRAGVVVDAGWVRTTLEAFHLKDIQVHEDPASRVIFSAWSGLACVVGVHHADETWVAVTVPLPDGRCVA